MTTGGSGSASAKARRRAHAATKAGTRRCGAALAPDERKSARASASAATCFSSTMAVRASHQTRSISSRFISIGLSFTSLEIRRVFIIKQKENTMPPRARTVVSSQDEGWRRVDAGAINQLHAVLRTDSMAPACLRAVENRLLSSGILFTTIDYSRRASEGFQTHINTHFTRFVREALRETVVCGWCFFTIDNDVPRVVPSNLADVRWRVVPDTFRVEIAVFKPGEEKPSKNVFSVVDQCVDCYGNIQSTVSEYMRTRSIYEAFMRNALHADRINAAPPIYTMTQTDHVFDERDITNTGELEDLRPAQVRGCPP